MKVKDLVNSYSGKIFTVFKGTYGERFTKERILDVAKWNSIKDLEVLDFYFSEEELSIHVSEEQRISKDNLNNLNSLSEEEFEILKESLKKHREFLLDNLKTAELISHGCFMIDDVSTEEKQHVVLNLREKVEKLTEILSKL